jgi:hypothetical protein
MIAKCAGEGLTVEEIDARAQGLVAFGLRALRSREPLPAFRPCPMSL